MSDFFEDNLAEQIVIDDPTGYVPGVDYELNLPIQVVLVDGNGNPYTPS